MFNIGQLWYERHSKGVYIICCSLQSLQSFYFTLILKIKYFSILMAPFWLYLVSVSF